MLPTKPVTQPSETVLQNKDPSRTVTQPSEAVLQNKDPSRTITQPSETVLQNEDPSRTVQVTDKQDKLSEQTVSESSDETPRTPVQKVIFLKTHKCASTVLQNILLRYAVNNNLTVVLPKEHNYLGHQQLFTRSIIKNTPWERARMKYDMFCLHTG